LEEANQFEFHVVDVRRPLNQVKSLDFLNNRVYIPIQKIYQAMKKFI